MRTIILSILLIPFLTSYSQSNDSIILESNNLTLSKNLSSQRYTLSNKNSYEQFTNLLFVKRIANYYQVLDAELHIFYIDNNWAIMEEVNDFHGVCGTVPHYELSITSTENNYDVWEDETFYDYGNKIPAEIKHTIQKSQADSIFFINGRNEFIFTSNFGSSIKTIQPRTIILKKDNLYFTLEQPNVQYDSLEFIRYDYSIKTILDGLYGYLNVTDPQYKKLDPFEYYLAKAETVDGTTIFIDINGNEYPSSTEKK